MSTHPSFMSWEDVNSLIGSIATHSLVSRPTTIDECRQTIVYAREHSLKICPRGAGRSYGDEALCHEQVLLDVTLQLKPIPSPYLAVRALPAPDVDALLAVMAEVEANNDIAVAWVSLCTRFSARYCLSCCIHSGRC